MTTSQSAERATTGTTPGAQLVDVRQLTVTAAAVRGGAPLPILDDVDLTVGLGEFVAVVGPSGCGKSTLLRAVAGLLPPGVSTSSGSRVDVVTGPGRRRDVAWMSQRDCLLPWRRAWGNALLGARVAGREPVAARAAAENLFERFGLRGFEHAWPHELSGGMRQRLALLRTVLAERRVLLLDEPFSGLDALTRRSMNAWLREIDLVGAGPLGGGVVLVTHDVDEAALLADRVVVMSARPGRVIATVPTGGDGDPHARHRLLRLLGVEQ